ncbi:MAG: bifunctional 5,10-methylenetetrahydrofolate dehydrogenase/5,10-methenyltetrahydrofolate cyclohydrolase [Candidatus Levybacteria bacterium]|nr:bifunctional 5,10-methylenetetrahydrofolate dehydrogenase/5,10-methenyltetrahydrofolate cyclohydrolase [Candidatus Levybacteria bacterium]
MKIDGKVVAEEILENLKERVEKLKERKVTPHLYIITFGTNPQTESYLKQKLLRAKQIGAKTTIKKFPVKVSPKTVFSLIENLNKDKKIHGIIVQRPLPKQIDEEKISLAITLPKDVDGFHPHSKFAPPVGLAVLKLIEDTLGNQDIYEFLKSKKIVLIGKGITAGKPIINLFKRLNIKVKIVDSKTKDRKKIIKSADIIVSSVGKRIIKKEDLKRNVLLIGVGMHTLNGKLKGDFDEEDIKDKVSFYSPTPGGVGPVNVTMLMKNLVEATEN